MNVPRLPTIDISKLSLLSESQISFEINRKCDEYVRQLSSQFEVKPGPIRPTQPQEITIPLEWVLESFIDSFISSDRAHFYKS